MSSYMFSPCPDKSTNEQNYAIWENAFSESELATIRKTGDALAIEEAIVNADDKIEKIRKSKVGWIAHNNETGWLYDRLAFIGRNVNGQFWDYDVYGFVEDFQYTVYSGGGSHYDWHMDKGNINSSPRKLSLVVQLTDPSEYEGGDLELQCGAEIVTAQRKAGIVYAFPSWLLHRVTPVTRGTRKSLVVWIAGPKFR